MRTGIDQLEELWQRGHQVVTPQHPSMAVMVGLDRVCVDYDWDGQRRSTDPRGRELIIQVSLEGCGEFITADGQSVLVPAGHFFCAVIPSAHRYRLAATSVNNPLPHWRIWWTQILHPEAVRRGELAIQTAGHVLPFDPGSEFAGALMRLSASVRSGHYEDALAMERDALTAAIELQRTAHVHAHGHDQRWQLESRIRTRVMTNRQHVPSLTELAALVGKEASAFGHYFRTLTGTSPGRFVTEVRLESVCRALQTTDDTLAMIAEQCGFADANHLCKVFRRRFGTSPGLWRAQTGRRVG